MTDKKRVNDKKRVTDKKRLKDKKRVKDKKVENTWNMWLLYSYIEAELQMIFT